MSGRGIKGQHDPIRSVDMCARFRAGETLQDIGDRYGVSRERVRQVIKRFSGITGRDGGRRVRARKEKLIRAANKDAYALRKWGCSFAQYRLLVSMKKPTGAYRFQKQNAKNRGIEWKFNLWQWWTIWQGSGKWDQRGRGQGKYCMARIGDTGAYEVGNVFICLCVENNSNRKEKKSGLPMGVQRRVVGKWEAYTAAKMIDGKSRYIGSFKTPEAAHNAYLSFGASV